jgi:polyhydroxyalkanoate synthesis regulator phasin
LPSYPPPAADRPFNAYLSIITRRNTVTLTSRLATLLLSTALAMPAVGPGFAQDASSTETNAVAAPTDGPTGTLVEVVEGIAATNEKTQARIDQLMADIDTATLQIEGANAAFDEMIDALRLQASVGDPTGEFVGKLEQLEQMARGDAEEAKLAGYADFEEAFLEDAEVFTSQRDNLIGEYEALERRIRAVESERERVVFMIKLRRYDEAQTLFDEASSIIQDGNDRISEVETALRERDQTLVEN